MAHVVDEIGLDLSWKSWVSYRVAMDVLKLDNQFELLVERGHRVPVIHFVSHLICFSPMSIQYLVFPCLVVVVERFYLLFNLFEGKF